MSTRFYFKEKIDAEKIRNLVKHTESMVRHTDLPVSVDYDFVDECFTVRMDHFKLRDFLGTIIEQYLNQKADK